MLIARIVIGFLGRTFKEGWGHLYSSMTGGRFYEWRAIDETPYS